VHRLFLIEGEHELILREAELRWVNELVREIQAGTLGGMQEWAAFHSEFDATDSGKTRREGSGVGRRRPHRPGERERIGKQLEIPLDAYRFGVELEGAEVAAAHGIGADGALLVRPDGFVAWRADVKDPERTLEHVLSRLLCRASA
jgi:Aromatic-ring hydroxylase, C-terminal